jgi:hypothetical protein
MTIKGKIQNFRILNLCKCFNNISMFIIISISLSSCATLFNSDKTIINIVVNEPTQLVVNGNSLNEFDGEKKLSLVEIRIH